MKQIIYEKSGHVGRVTLNRPEALNAITAQMNEQLQDAWRDIDADPRITVAVLDSSIDRAFCAGGDLREASQGPAWGISHGGGLTGLNGRLVPLRKPLVAAVKGLALGAGFELALCADIIVAAENAEFAAPEARIGFIGGAGVMHRALRQLPHRVAMAMILTGDRLPAHDAKHYGLVNEVVPLDDMAMATSRWVAKLQEVSPLAAQAVKEAAAMGSESSLSKALATEYPLTQDYRLSEDLQEARQAFAQKRPPVWRGR